MGPECRGRVSHPESGLCLTDLGTGTTNRTQPGIAPCAGAGGQLMTLPKPGGWRSSVLLVTMQFHSVDLYLRAW